MTWAVGILTWNRAERCRQTIASVEAGIVGDYELTVLDNGSDPPFESVEHRVVRSPTNLGAGAGLSELVRQLLSDGPDYLLCLEDDWDLELPVRLDSLEAILADDRVGQVRLGMRPRNPSAGYWTYALEGDAAERSLAQRWNAFHRYDGGRYQLVHLLWSNNPFACRAEVAVRFLLTGRDEIQMARPYLASGMLTASVTPGHFRHAGEIRERRQLAGWKK